MLPAWSSSVILAEWATADLSSMAAFDKNHFRLVSGTILALMRGDHDTILNNAVVGGEKAA